MPYFPSHLSFDRSLTLPFLLLIAASVAMSVSASRLERFPGDLPVAEWVQSISVPLLDGFLRGVSAVGWWILGSVITLSLGFILFTLGRKSDSGLFMALVAMSAASNWVIKRIIASPRPEPSLVDVHEELTTYGFPSGHVMFTVVCFGGLAIFLNEVQGRYVALAKLAQVVLVLLVVAMAMSRVYLGAHWPSDTLGALVMGGVSLIALVGVRGMVAAEAFQCVRITAIPVAAQLGVSLSQWLARYRSTRPYWY